MIRVNFYYDGRAFGSRLTLIHPQIGQHIDLNTGGLYVVQEVRWIVETGELNVYLFEAHTEGARHHEECK
jgi:hypothetical protein